MTSTSQQMHSPDDEVIEITSRFPGGCPSPRCSSAERLVKHAIVNLTGEPIGSMKKEPHWKWNGTDGACASPEETKIFFLLNTKPSNFLGEKLEIKNCNHEQFNK